jgi:hypothetical protein
MTSTELEVQRAKSEAREVARCLEQWVGLALDLGTSADEVNAYLRAVRNFVFRHRPADSLLPRRTLEVVR